MSKEPTIKVIYNSACPVCDAGISSQKKKSASCNVSWQDVHLDHELAKNIGADVEFVRKRLHAIDENGNLKVGFEAFILIWENSPSERWKAKISKLPILRQVLGIMYNAFAWCLYTWNRALKHW